MALPSVIINALYYKCKILIKNLKCLAFFKIVITIHISNNNKIMSLYYNGINSLINILVITYNDRCQEMLFLIDLVY